MFRSAPWPVKGLFFLIVGALFIFVVSFAVYLLWNAILPKVSPLKEISYWQAMGILLLSKILFGSMHFGKGRHRSKIKKKFNGRWQEKWHGMSEEERAQMKQRWKERCERRSKDF